MSENKTKNIVDVLREQANILSANGRGGEYLDHAADKIEELEESLLVERTVHKRTRELIRHFWETCIQKDKMVLSDIQAVHLNVILELQNEERNRP